MSIVDPAPAAAPAAQDGGEGGARPLLPLLQRGRPPEPTLKSKTKNHSKYAVNTALLSGQGGYLKGEIQLPAEREDIKLVISTYPGPELQYSPALLEAEPAIAAFHPTLLQVPLQFTIQC